MPMEQTGRTSMEEWDELFQDQFKKYPKFFLNFKKL